MTETQKATLELQLEASMIDALLTKDQREKLHRHCSGGCVGEWPARWGSIIKIKLKGDMEVVWRKIR